MIKSPQIRYPQYHDEWTEVKLSDIVNRITDKNVDLITNRVLTISAQQGLVDQLEYFNKSMASKNIKNYHLLHNGDFAYNKSYSKNYPWGSVKRLDKYDYGALSPLYICFRNKMSINSEYLKQYFDSTLWYKQIYEIAVEGARNHGLLNISICDFFNTSYKIPSIQEQEKIGSLFQVLDDLIMENKEKLERLKEQKRGLLQVMFPNESGLFSPSNIPQLRYPQYHDEWKEVQIKDIAEINPSSEIPDVFEYVDLESVVGTEMIAHKNMAKKQTPSRAQRLAKYGDLFYQTVRPYQKNNYIFEKKGKEKYVFSSGYTQLRPIINNYFLISIVQTNAFLKQVLSRCTGTSYPAISSKDLGEIKIKIPSKQEQEKIGGLFKKIDTLIKLTMKEIDLLILQKKGLLQKMFI